MDISRKSYWQLGQIKQYLGQIQSYFFYITVMFAQTYENFAGHVSPHPPLLEASYHTYHTIISSPSLEQGLPTWIPFPHVKKTTQK